MSDGYESVVKILCDTVRKLDGVIEQEIARKPKDKDLLKKVGTLNAYLNKKAHEFDQKDGQA